MLFFLSANQKPSLGKVAYPEMSALGTDLSCMHTAKTSATEILCKDGAIAMAHMLQKSGQSRSERKPPEVYK